MYSERFNYYFQINYYRSRPFLSDDGDDRVGSFPAITTPFGSDVLLLESEVELSSSGFLMACNSSGDKIVNLDFLTRTAPSFEDELRDIDSSSLL
jgi:hypothetical protein